MKDIFLKLAGVKDEKSFYKKFPTEEAFMAKHGKALKKAQLGASIQDKGQTKKLKQLTDFGNPPIAQDGFNILNASQTALSQPYNTQEMTTGAQQLMGGLQYLPQLIGGIQQYDQQQKDIANAQMYEKLSELTEKAAKGPVQPIKHKYVRPEDVLIQPNQLGSPTGTGTNYLAKDGALLNKYTGPVTEIQNTYQYPVTNDTDAGYTPLTSDNPKQYKKGGKIPKAELGDYLQSSGQSSIGNSVGGALGFAVGGAPGAAIGSFLGGIAGNVFGGAEDKQRIANLQADAQKHQLGAALANVKYQNAAYMEDGGQLTNPRLITKFDGVDVTKLHDIFTNGMNTLRTGGNIRENENLDGDLQVHWGGKMEHISQNPYLPEGGNTVMPVGQSHDESDGKGRSGIGVTFGQNPVEVERGEPMVKLQDGGTGDNNLVVFGNMKIPNFGVKEIGDELAKGKKFKTYVNTLSEQEAKQNTKLDKATDLINNADTNYSFGQLAMNSGKATLIGANIKLKDIAQKKQNASMVQKAILDTAEENGWDSDALAKGKIKTAKKGANIKKAQQGGMFIPDPNNPGLIIRQPQDIPQLPTYTEIKSKSGKGRKTTPSINLDGVITTPSIGLGNEADDFNIDTRSSYAPSFNDINKGIMSGTYTNTPVPMSINPVQQWSDLNADIMSGKYAGGKYEGNYTEQQPSNKHNNLITAGIASLLGGFKPSNKMPLDPNQLMAENFALATNQLEPVKAQGYTPMLSTPQSISLQDQINAVDSQARAALKSAKDNPAAASAIMAQAIDAKNRVLGEQFRMNQAARQQTYEQNRQTVNDANLKNLAIYDQQYTRQEQAKGKTKAQAIEALKSISDKIAKNKLENRQLGIYENLYNYRFTPDGQVYSVNGPAVLNMQGNPSAMRGADGLTDYERELAKYKAFKDQEDKKIKEASKSQSRNGNIVKAIKNL